MDFFKYLGKAVWGNAGNLYRVGKAVLFSGPIVMSVASGAIGYPLLLSWCGWALAALFVGIGILTWSFARSGYQHEKRSFPKLTVSEPIEVRWPKGAPAQCIREFKLEIANQSTTKVENCQVQKIGLINKYGNESDSIGLRFRLSQEKAIGPGPYPHQQSFSLAPGTSERIDLVMWDEPQSTKVVFLYANPGRGDEDIRNTIPLHFFPHDLTIRIAADNVAYPITKTYRVSVDGGILSVNAKEAGQ